MVSTALSVSLYQRGPIPLKVAFDCNAGELVALVGPSGSGKTTVLRSIAGLHNPAEGRISCAGQVWFDRASKSAMAPGQRHVGIVFQSYGLFPHLSAIENVEEAMTDRPRRERTARAAELLSRFHLKGLERRRPRELSGGEQQRVAVARALARDPKVLLLDEPFSAVDQVTREQLYRELAELRASIRIPIVLVTHDLHEARLLADTMVILDQGESLQQGAPRHVLRSPRNARVAGLIGIQNHFKGVFARTDDSSGQGLLHWGEDRAGPSLTVIDKGKIDDGAAVTWVIAGEYLSLELDSTEGVNLIPGTLVEILPLGEIALCTARIDSLSADSIRVSVPAALMRAQNLSVGSKVRISLEPSGIHVMPLRTGKSVPEGSTGTA